jgi:hypothetical protein
VQYQQKEENQKVKVVEEQKQEQQSLDAWSLYLYAMKSPVTREKYTGRLSKFLEFTGLRGTLEE